MLRDLRSAVAGGSGHSPATPPPAPAEDDDEEESARPIAVSDQRTIYLVNMFIANTVEFLNSFTALCNDKLALLHRKTVKLDSSLTLLEAELHSIGDTNALGHSTSQKAHQSLAHDEIFDSANLLGEPSSQYYHTRNPSLGPNGSHTVQLGPSHESAPEGTPEEKKEEAVLHCSSPAATPSPPALLPLRFPRLRFEVW